MELKWLAIMVMVLMTGTYIGMALQQYEQTQCRVAAIQAGKNSADIVAICK